MVKTLPSLIASLRHYIALYQGNIVPLPGTKRYVGRENPHSLFYSSLFTKSAETPINTGVPRGEEWRTTLHHSSPTLHLDILFIGLRWVNRAFLLHGLRTDSVRRLSSVRRPSGFATVRRPSGFAIRCKKMFDLWNRGICNPPPSIYKQLAKKSGVKSGEESSALFTLSKQLIRKHLRHSGEGWRVFLKVADNRYKLQRITNPQRKGRTFFNSGLQIRWDA